MDIHPVVVGLSEWDIFLRPAANVFVGGHQMEVYLTQVNTATRKAAHLTIQDGDLVMKEISPGEAYEPSFVIPATLIQAMVDGFYAHGFTPKDRRYETEIDLLRDHLEDMRALVFKLEPRKAKEERK